MREPDDLMVRLVAAVPPHAGICYGTLASSRATHGSAEKSSRSRPLIGNPKKQLAEATGSPEAVTVTVTNPDAPSDYDETELEGALRIDDLLCPELDNVHPVGTPWLSVTGILGRSFDHQKLWPRTTTDLEP